MRQSFLLLIPVLLLAINHRQLSGKDINGGGGELRIGFFEEGIPLNPLTTDAGFSSGLMDLLFDTLVTISSGGEIKPALAEKWEVSPDGLIWTFHLKKGVQFHDGTPLTARDVKFTYEKIRGQKRDGRSHFFKFVRQIKALDSATLEISFSRHDNILWGGLLWCGIVPMGLLEKDSATSKFNQHPIGSGPYRFLTKTDKEITLVRNEGYFGEKPFLQKIAARFYPNQRTIMSHLVAEGIDMTFLLNPKDYHLFDDVPTLKVYHNRYPLLYMLTPNRERKFFRESSVIRALNMAIDRRDILKRVLEERGILETGFEFPDSLMAYRPDVSLKILNEGGWRDRDGDSILDKGGERFEFTALNMEGEEVGLATLRLIQGQLRKIGIKMDIEIVRHDKYIERVYRKREFDASILSFVSRPYFATSFILWHSGQIKDGFNFASYQNTHVDRFLEQLRFSREERERISARKSLLEELERDPPGIFLFGRLLPIAIHTRFQGIPEEGTDPLRDLIYLQIPENQGPETGQK